MSVNKIPKLGENRANLRGSFSQIGRNFSQNFLILGGYPGGYPPPWLCSFLFTITMTDFKNCFLSKQLIEKCRGDSNV
jgi:hypothetical protein